MRYIEIMQAVDPLKALMALDKAPKCKGAYIYFDCSCGKTASIKAYGARKNLFICNHCKNKGHIIGLVCQAKEADWEGAKQWLKPFCASQRRILTDLPFRYELQYSDILEKKGLSKEFCQEMGIGKPKGKTMLAGCIAFEVRQEAKVVAYYGIRIKDGSPVFHNSFNPELFLWGHNHDFKDKEVLLARDMFECARMMSEGKLAVSNFGLPYLSLYQLDTLKRYQSVVFKKDDSEVARQIMDSECSFKIV
jgi:hypothetical protein